nr:4568_t:CDS:2 [Entrophospora candida]
MLKANGHKIDLDNLDLNRTYTFEEFEFINEQLKTHALEINETPVDLFEFNKGKILPMPQNPISKEAVVCEISSQLCNWNVQTRENGITTTSQGGFDFNISGQRAICAPDVAFTPKNIYCLLNHQQQWTFKGQPFTPTCVVEVAVTQEGYQEFNDLDQKFREVYFATGSSVELGWLVDPQNKQIYIYRQRANRVVYRTSHGWDNVNGGNVLPGFTLEVEKIDDAISQESSESSSSSESDETINCPKCGATFSNDYTFMKHYEDNHARKWHKKE